jgi:hypothetical protein
MPAACKSHIHTGGHQVRHRRGLGLLWDCCWDHNQLLSKAVPRMAAAGQHNHRIEARAPGRHLSPGFAAMPGPAAHAGPTSVWWKGWPMQSGTQRRVGDFSSSDKDCRQSIVAAFGGCRCDWSTQNPHCSSSRRPCLPAPAHNGSQFQNRLTNRTVEASWVVSGSPKQQ